jgi:hypothetical protein
LAHEALGGEEYTPSVVATIASRESAAASVVFDIASDMHEQSLRGKKSTPHVAVPRIRVQRILSVLLLKTSLNMAENEPRGDKTIPSNIVSDGSGNCDTGYILYIYNIIYLMHYILRTVLDL